MLKGSGKTLAWVLAATFGLFVVAYGVLLVVNREDRPPSSDIAAIQALQSTTPVVVDEQNAYLYSLGLEAPRGTDPMELGLKRREWMRTAGPDFDAGDPLDDGNSLTQSAEIFRFRRTCTESVSECLQFLKEDDGEIERLLGEESLLIERYVEMTSMPRFREPTPFLLYAPMPSYSFVFDGQYLAMLRAWRSASAGDADSVRTTLERDLVFWRMVLANSDALITKMIATAAIVQHFKLGNLVLRRLPDAKRAAGIPASWRNEITQTERSMRRCLAGEWQFVFQSINQYNAENVYGEWTGLADSTTFRRIGLVLLSPFFQPQDLGNRHARLFLDIGNAFDVPYGEIPGAVEVANQLQESAYSRFSRLYNFGGDLLMAGDTGTMSNYAVRVSDIEGVRRAALLVAELRADGVNKDNVSQRALTSDIVDPYTDEPFAWHNDTDAIVFHGLGPYDRSVHKLVY